MGSNAILVFVMAAADVADRSLACEPPCSYLSVLTSLLPGFRSSPNQNDNIVFWFRVTVLEHHTNANVGLLLYALIKIVFWWIVCGLLYRYQLFWKI
jgi:hypothetical protein